MCISLDHRDQGLRVGESLADLRPRRRRPVELEVRELGPVWKSTMTRVFRRLAAMACWGRISGDAFLGGARSRRRGDGPRPHRHAAAAIRKNNGRRSLGNCFLGKKMSYVRTTDFAPLQARRLCRESDTMLETQ